MKLSKFQPPYNSKGRTNYRFTEGLSGVYIIMRDGEIMYIGFSGTNLYKTMYRHFQKWNMRGQVVVTYYGEDRDRFKVRVILCKPAKAEKLERALIVKHKPKDNPNKLRGYIPTRKEEAIYEEYTFTHVTSNKELEEASF